MVAGSHACLTAAQRAPASGCGGPRGRLRGGARAAVAAIGLIAGAAAAQGAEILEHGFEVDRPDFTFWVTARLDSPREAVWEVLTDYERLHELSPGVQRSRILPDTAGEAVVVVTVVRGCVAIFCRDVERAEAMVERPPEWIRGRILPERSDFERGETEWTLEAEGEATRVSVRSELRPTFWVPPVIGPRQMQRALIGDMRTLMDRVEERAGQRRQP